MKNITKNINVFRNSTWIAWAENIALAFIIAITFYITLDIETYYPQKKTLTIPQHTTEESIISQLNKNHYDIGFIDSFLLTIINKIKKGHIKEGTIHFQQPLINRIDFLYALKMANNSNIINSTKIKQIESKKKIDLFKLMLIPGETKEIFFEEIAKKLDINTTKLLSAYNTYSYYPEAGISADTYLAPKKMNEEKLIKFLLKSSERHYKKLSENAFGEYNQTKWRRILIIASIIQKEAANNKEMPLVASVIYNRLKKNMRLQMDGTLNYGKYSHIKVTPERIKTDLSSFNTYKHRGLPDSPIGSVGTHAIKAAINPAETNYLYFMRNKDGVHDFTDTFKKHRKNIRKVK